MPRIVLLVPMVVALFGCDAGTGDAQPPEPAAEPASPAPERPAPATEGERPQEPPRRTPRLSFADAVRAAARAQPGLPALEVRLWSRPPPARFRVTFLGDKGAYAVDLDTTRGRLLERSHAVIEPRRGGFTPALRRELEERPLGLVEAVEMAEDRVEGELVSVAWQSYEDELVIAVDALDDGVRVSELLDPETGESVGG